MVSRVRPRIAMRRPDGPLIKAGFVSRSQGEGRPYISTRTQPWRMKNALPGRFHPLYTPELACHDAYPCYPAPLLPPPKRDFAPFECREEDLYRWSKLRERQLIRWLPTNERPQLKDLVTSEDMKKYRFYGLQKSTSRVVRNVAQVLVAHGSRSLTIQVATRLKRAQGDDSHVLGVLDQLVAMISICTLYGARGVHKLLCAVCTFWEGGISRFWDAVVVAIELGTPESIRRACLLHPPWINAAPLRCALMCMHMEYDGSPRSVPRVAEAGEMRPFIEAPQRIPWVCRREVCMQMFLNFGSFLKKRKGSMIIAPFESSIISTHLALMRHLESGARAAEEMVNSQPLESTWITYDGYIKFLDTCHLVFDEFESVSDTPGDIAGWDGEDHERMEGLKVGQVLSSCWISGQYVMHGYIYIEWNNHSGESVPIRTQDKTINFVNHLLVDQLEMLGSVLEEQRYDRVARGETPLPYLPPELMARIGAELAKDCGVEIEDPSQLAFSVHMVPTPGMIEVFPEVAEMAALTSSRLQSMRDDDELAEYMLNMHAPAWQQAPQPVAFYDLTGDD